MNLFKYHNNFEKYASVKSNRIFGEPKVSAKISILMPVFRNLKFFEVALESALNQDFCEDYNVIIINNNPEPLENDEFYKILSTKYNACKKIVYYKNEQNVGMSGNWNRCIELAPTDLIVFLHDDDQLKTNNLSELYEIYKKNKKTVFPTNCVIDCNSKVIRRENILDDTTLYDTTLYDAFLGLNVSHNSGTLFIKKQLLAIGGYSDVYYPCADWAINVQIVHSFGAVFTKKELVCIRKAENTSAEVYRKFAPMLFTIRQQMIPCIKYPTLLLNLFCIILKKSDYINAAKEWSGVTVKKHLSLIEKIIIKLAIFIQKIQIREIILSK